MQYNFNVVNDKMVCDKREMPLTGNVNTYRCVFQIECDIENLLWFCVFEREGKAFVQPILENECYIPHEVLISEGAIKIGCYATNLKQDDYKRISTNWVYFNSLEGAYSEASVPDVPEPDVWEEIVLKSVPIIGENGNWFIYDITQMKYVDSGVKAEGDTPVKGEDYWNDEDKDEIKKFINDEVEDIEATAVKSLTVLKNPKTIGWVKFATIPYVRGWRSEGALLYLNNHYVDGRFGALVYIGLNPNAEDYHDNNGIVLKQIAGEDITARIAYIKNADTKELTLYFRKDAHTVLNISSIFNNIDSLVFEPSNDTCEVLSSINPTGKAIYINAPMATKAECDSNGNNIKDTYATKEQLKDSVNFKGVKEESYLPVDGNKKGDLYKIKTTTIEPVYRYLSSGELVYNSWYADFDGDGVDELISDGTGFDSSVGEALLTQKELDEYSYTGATYPINIYDANKEFIKSTTMFEAGEISTWVVDTSGLTLGETYYIERTDGVVPDRIEPETIGETTTVKDNGYALYNGEAFDKLYTQEMVNEKIAYATDLKLIKKVTLEEAVTDVNFTFNKPLSEIVVFFKGAFDTALNNKGLAVRSNSGAWYMFWRVFNLYTSPRCFYAHAKEIGERIWETHFLSNLIASTLQGTADCAQGEMLNISKRSDRISRYVNDLNIFVVGRETNMSVGTEIEIWGREVE